MASSMRWHHSLHHCTVSSLSSFDAIHLVTTQPIWKRTNSANKEGKKIQKGTSGGDSDDSGGFDAFIVFLWRCSALV